MAYNQADPNTQRPQECMSGFLKIKEMKDVSMCIYKYPFYGEGFRSSSGALTQTREVSSEIIFLGPEGFTLTLK